MPRKFSIEKIATEKEEPYQRKILKIIDNYERYIRLISQEESFLFKKETHQKRLIDTAQELKELEPARHDICQSFGIIEDPEHQIIISSEKNPQFQRAFRAFFVLIDALTGEGFYGEGRRDHQEILKKILELVQKRNIPLTLEDLVEDLSKENHRWLVFKGFLSSDNFQGLSSLNRKLLETPLVDKDGEIIETPANWIITGHNLLSPSS